MGIFIGPKVGLKSLLRVGVNTSIIGGSQVATATAAPATTTMTAVLSDSADPVINGKNFDITLVMTNTDVADAISVSAAVTLDSNLTFVSASGAGWTCNASGQVVTCTMATMVAGAAPTITITVTAANVAGVTASTTVSATAANVVGAATDTETTSLQLIARDATSLKYVPSGSTQWTNFLAYNSLTAIGNPTSAWLCQEAAGNLADSIGSGTLTAANTPTYQAAVAGWTRVGVHIADGTSQRFSMGTGVGPSPALISSTWVGIFSMPAAPATTRRMFGPCSTASTTSACIEIDSAGKVQGKCLTVETTTGPVVAGGVHLLGCKYDRTNSAFTILADHTTFAGTYGAGVVDAAKGLSGATTAGAATTMVYAMMWSGANGEISDANLAALGLALGF